MSAFLPLLLDALEKKRRIGRSGSSLPQPCGLRVLFQTSIHNNIVLPGLRCLKGYRNAGRRLYLTSALQHQIPVDRGASTSAAPFPERTLTASRVPPIRHHHLNLGAHLFHKLKKLERGKLAPNWSGL